MVQNLANLVNSVVRPGPEDNNVETGREPCIVCDLDLSDSEFFEIFRVCPQCHFHYSMSARERIESLVDSNSFSEFNRTVVSLDPLSFASGGAGLSYAAGSVLMGFGKWVFAGPLG